MPRQPRYELQHVIQRDNNRLFPRFLLRIITATSTACARRLSGTAARYWQFDVSVSDVYYLAEQKPVPEAGQSGYSHLGLFSVVEENLRSEVPSDLPGGITLPAGTMQAVFCRGQILR
jgi:hypothetical protein